MVLTDAEELRSPVITSDMSFFDLESNHSSDSVHLLCEKYTHKLPIESESQTTFRLTPIKQKLYKQNTLYVPLTLKQRFVLFTKWMRSIWARVPSCKPNKYTKVAFALAVLTPLAIWIFYIDFHLTWYSDRSVGKKNQLSPSINHVGVRISYNLLISIHSTRVLSYTAQEDDINDEKHVGMKF